MQCSHGLWRDLSEENDQYRQNCTCHCHHRSAKIVSQGGSKGSGGKIHHIITDQDRTQHLAGIIGNIHNGFARLLPSSARPRIRIRFTVVKAVSADEKILKESIKSIE